ncbi:hypothetical protein ACSQ67_025939 [Phaseolus vulgaris]
MDLNRSFLTSFRVLVEQLGRLNISQMEHDGQIAFWINVHNALVMHGSLKRLALFHKVVYFFIQLSVVSSKKGMTRVLEGWEVWFVIPENYGLYKYFCDSFSNYPTTCIDTNRLIGSPWHWLDCLASKSQTILLSLTSAEASPLQLSVQAAYNICGHIISANAIEQVIIGFRTPCIGRVLI